MFFGPLVSCHAEKGETVWIFINLKQSRLLVNLLVATKVTMRQRKFVSMNMS